MKDLKIGKLLLSKKAILLIAFCMFLNGMTIGALVVSKDTDLIVNFLFFFMTIFAPYVLFYKAIKNNIQELE